MPDDPSIVSVMSRTSQEWSVFVQQLAARLNPAMEAVGLAPLASPRLALDGDALVAYELASQTIVLGFPADGSQPASAAYAALLGLEGEELEHLLELLVTRQALHALGRHLRVIHGAATGDEWVENEVANALAYAATVDAFGPHRAFLTEVLGRTIRSLEQRRRPSFSDPRPGEKDPVLLPSTERLLRELVWFAADNDRTDVPSLEVTLQTLVGAESVAERRSAESEVVLLRTFTDGPLALRRTAAELFAAEASAEAIGQLLASQRPMPSDVRLMLAQELLSRGETAPASTCLVGLATSDLTPPPVAAAAALLLETPSEHSLDVPALLAELEQSGLSDALKLVRSLPTPAGITAVWPMLAHPAAPVRKEAYRLLAHGLPESDSWTGISDPEPSIRQASVLMLSPRPGLPRALAELVTDTDTDVRRAAITRARSEDSLANEVGTILIARETDEGRMAGAGVVAHRVPDWAERVLAGVFARTIRPFMLAVLAARSAEPWDRALALAEQLASDTLDRHRRELLSFAAEVFGRSDWFTLYETSQQAGVGATEAAGALADTLPPGWESALFQSVQSFDPLSALRDLALTHPEPLVRAALLLWLLRSGHESPAHVAAMAGRDPSHVVAEISPLAHAHLEGPMALTAIEKALFLRTVPLFRSVPTQSLLAIGGAMIASSHPAGDVIVKQGEMGDRLFVLHQGRAEAVREDGGVRKVLATLEPGAVFGEMALFDLEPRSASVVTLEPCEALMLDAQTFHRLGVQFPDILWEICRVLTQRLRVTGQNVGARPVARTSPRSPHVSYLID